MSESGEQQSTQVLEVVVDEDGQEWFGGHKLPPDNDEPWNVGENWQRYGEFVYDENCEPEYVLTRRTLTNSFVRQRNIEFIQEGGQPLFITWEEVDLDVDALRQGEQGFFRRVRGRLLDKLFPAIEESEQ